MRVPLSVYVDQETADLVRSLALHLNAPKGEVIRRAVRRFQTQMLEHYQKNVAVAQMKKAVATGIDPNGKPLDKDELDKVMEILASLGKD